MNKVSLVIACLALLVSTAGGAYAGASILIGSKQIKDHSVQYVDLSKKAAAKLRGQRGPQGPQGPQGLVGLPGTPGTPGAAGGFDPSKISYVTGPTKTFHPGDIDFVEAVCPAGTKIIGGGYFANIMHVAGDQTYGDGGTWSVLINNDTSIDVDANATAVCAAK
jgi:hypothetical protein